MIKDRQFARQDNNTGMEDAGNANWERDAQRWEHNTRMMNCKQETKKNTKFGRNYCYSLYKETSFFLSLSSHIY